MRIDRFTIQRALSLNNFQSGGKERWIVYLHGDEKMPCLFETLDAAFEWIDCLTKSAPHDAPQFKRVSKMEETWENN